MAGRIAILKPDHLGDVVLATPAARRIVAAHAGHDVDFLCAPGAEPLVRWLLPGVRPVALPCPHLDKTGAHANASPPRLPQGYEFVWGLRADDVLNAAWLAAERAAGAFVRAGHLEHETRSQKRLVAERLGDFSRTAMFFPSSPPSFPRRFATVGLCIAAGFVNNRWDMVAWFRLGRILARSGAGLRILGGPLETRDAEMLRSLLGLPAAHVILGDGTFDDFTRRVEQAVDVVIATDSGAAHLCSRVKPILSIFGPSPHLRYAPFGRHNRLVRADVDCSPCCQFSRDTLNACVTRECLAALEPADVAEALFESAPPEPAVRRRGGLELVFGASHLGPAPGGSGQPPSR